MATRAIAAYTGKYWLGKKVQRIYKKRYLQSNDYATDKVCIVTGINVGQVCRVTGSLEVVSPFLLLCHGYTVFHGVKPGTHFPAVTSFQCS